MVSQFIEFELQPIPERPLAVYGSPSNRFIKQVKKAASVIDQTLWDGMLKAGWNCGAAETLSSYDKQAPQRHTLNKLDEAIFGICDSKTKKIIVVENLHAKSGHVQKNKDVAATLYHEYAHALFFRFGDLYHGQSTTHDLVLAFFEDLKDLQSEFKESNRRLIEPCEAAAEVWAQVGLLSSGQNFNPEVIFNFPHLMIRIASFYPSCVSGYAMPARQSNEISLGDVRLPTWLKDPASLMENEINALISFGDLKRPTFKYAAQPD